MTYQTKLRALLSPAEHRVFKKLNTPHRIQDYLEALPQNFSRSREGSCRSVRRIVAEGKAYCLEGAVLAAASLAYHGSPPLLLDIKTTDHDEEHVVALFKDGGRWGAISKTNHPVLRWRDPVYKSVRELAMSYFNEYFLWQNGEKTMYSHSRAFGLHRYPPSRWVTTESSLEWLADALDRAPHSPVAPAGIIKTKLRKASKIERAVLELEEWSRTGRRTRV